MGVSRGLFPYFEPYEGRRPIVERVPECRPRGPAGTSLHFAGEFYWRSEAADENRSSWEAALNQEGVPSALALTREAIEAWLTTPNSTTTQGPELIVTVLQITDDCAKRIGWRVCIDRDTKGSNPAEWEDAAFGCAICSSTATPWMPAEWEDAAFACADGATVHQAMNAAAHLAMDRLGIPR